MAMRIQNANMKVANDSCFTQKYRNQLREIDAFSFEEGEGWYEKW